MHKVFDIALFGLSNSDFKWSTLQEAYTWPVALSDRYYWNAIPIISEKFDSDDIRFWRTTNQKEIDFVVNGAFEFVAAISDLQGFLTPLSASASPFLLNFVTGKQFVTTTAFMKQLKKEKLWPRVKKLRGKTLCTYVEGDANTVVSIEDTGSPYDRVIFAERTTFPTKGDLEAAYQILILQKKLKRTDLEWLSHPPKKVSSIVFRIVGEIAKDHAILDHTFREPALLIPEIKDK